MWSNEKKGLFLFSTIVLIVNACYVGANLYDRIFNGRGSQELPNIVSDIFLQIPYGVVALGVPLLNIFNGILILIMKPYPSNSMPQVVHLSVLLGLVILQTFWLM